MYNILFLSSSHAPFLYSLISTLSTYVYPLVMLLFPITYLCIVMLRSVHNMLPAPLPLFSYLYAIYLYTYYNRVADI